MNDDIEQEIKSLKHLMNKWNYKHANKQDGWSFRNELRGFTHSIEVNYPFASKYYYHNSSAEIDLTDAKKSLEIYIDSRLKKKDDKYFYDSVEKARFGLNDLIVSLENVK